VRRTDVHYNTNDVWNASMSGFFTYIQTFLFFRIMKIHELDICSCVHTQRVYRGEIKIYYAKIYCTVISYCESCIGLLIE